MGTTLKLVRRISGRALIERPEFSAFPKLADQEFDRHDPSPHR